MIEDFLAQDERKDMLRLLTAGSVDDGKSTLIGRLLFDSKRLYEDQLEALCSHSRQGGSSTIDYARLCDGLKAEREQGITIDVAYRYFATSKRKFIIADTPGHEQYTRNMVTGCSTADLAIVLVDVRQGITTQTMRHSHLIAMLGIGHIILAVNKMDLVGFDRQIFERIASCYRQWVAEQGFVLQSLTAIPISALCGDNIVERSVRCDWYKGLSLLEVLESVPIARSCLQRPFRMAIQYVIRPNQDFRGFAGRIASGMVSVGDKIVTLPSGKSATVEQILAGQSPLQCAYAPQSIAIVLDKQIDLSRGDMVVIEGQQRPAIGQKITATIVWMDEQPMDSQKLYYLKHGAHTVRARVSRIEYLLDINSGRKSECNTLTLNSIAAVEILCCSPIICDSYNSNRQTGAFIIIDPMTNFTSAAGIIAAAEQAEVGECAEVVDISLSKHGIDCSDMEMLNRFCKVVERQIGITINCTE